MPRLSITLRPRSTAALIFVSMAAGSDNSAQTKRTTTYPMSRIRSSRTSLDDDLSGILRRMKWLAVLDQSVELEEHAELGIAEVDPAEKVPFGE